MIYEKPGEYNLRITDENVLKGYLFLDGVYRIVKSESIKNLDNSELEEICDESFYQNNATIIDAPEYLSTHIKANLRPDYENSTWIAENVFFETTDNSNHFYATGTTPREAMRNLYETMKEFHRTLEDSPPSENEPQNQVMKQYLNILFTRPD